ncbi:MAG: flagellar motor protein MotD [Gammaproteobacteria bacterium]|jgi:chemotaxis protein MotB|nr:flagellar motor protein MotD [Gammaproteobacteria bacterium]MBU0772124.1 flagellar motor protein MotD [Gammaproteobacteria bacterium]MBU1848739.1 flagellar motor protein MotD [Gammaproteobacteria bacterium]
MRNRRYVPESEENHDRWLVSYADLVTLLFAFFVVMYAISQVNEGKYRVLSQSLNSAFAARDGARLIELPATDPGEAMQIELEQLRMQRAAQKEQERKERADTAARDLKQALSALTRDGQASVTEGALGITVDLDAQFLFGAGEAALAPAAQPVIAAMARVLLYSEFPLVIEGHTDNVPASGRLGSNWELSALRAATVTRVFAEQGIIPARLTAAGLADQRPVADNATEEGRAKNRRVSIRIETYATDRASTGDPARHEPASVPEGSLGSSFPRL